MVDCSHSGRGAAWLARLLGVQEVPGSNPGGPTKSKPYNGLDVFRHRQEGSKIPLAMDLCQLQELLQKERRYLHDVSPNTLKWYKCSFRPFVLREGKLQASSINGYIRELSAFLGRAKDEGDLSELIRLDCLKEEQELIATLSALASETPPPAPFLNGQVSLGGGNSAITTTKVYRILYHYDPGFEGFIDA